MNPIFFLPHCRNRICLLIGRLFSASSDNNAWLLALCLSSPVFADNKPMTEPLTIHGFASQALVFTTDNHFFGQSQQGSADFTELGINASYSLLPRIRLAAQLLSRRAGKMDRGSPRLDYALIDAKLLSSMQGQLGLYLGRIKNPIGLYNETRDVAFTRPGIFSTQSIYFDKIRNVLVSSDGIQFYSQYSAPFGTVSLRLGGGYPLTDRNIEAAYLGQDFAGKLTRHRPAYLGQIMYEDPARHWLFSVSSLASDMNFKSHIRDQLSGIQDGRLAIDYTVLSAQYSGEQWQLTSEMAFESIRYHGISAFYPTQNTHSLGYYLEARYRLSPDLQSFIRHERFYLDKNDKYGKQYHAQYPFASAASRFNIAWVAGFRWDMSPDWMIQAEYQTHTGVAILSPAENDLDTAARSWNLFAVSLSYHF